jgi:hypothetical protein
VDIDYMKRYHISLARLGTRATRKVSYSSVAPASPRLLVSSSGSALTTSIPWEVRDLGYEIKSDVELEYKNEERRNDGYYSQET